VGGEEKNNNWGWKTECKKKEEMKKENRGQRES
jgi:hypothetical protein